MLLFTNFSNTESTWILANSPAENYEYLSDNSRYLDAIDRCEAIVGWNILDNRLQGKSIIELPGIAPDNYTAIDCIHKYFEDVSNIIPRGCSYSNEQWAVINAVECGYNVLCSAVAGAGKTTTLLICAIRAPTKRHLLITYNKKLQSTVANRANSLNIRNLTVKTYHAIAGISYRTVVRNDEKFRELIKNPPEIIYHFDVLMLDETQDMSVEYYVLIRYLLNNNPDARVIIVGDKLQCISEFRGAHSGFLTEAENLYTTRNKKWVKCSLNISHRITPANAHFINTHIYNAPILIGGNHRDANLKPIYLMGIRDRWNPSNDTIVKILSGILNAAISKYGCENIYLLAPSVRNLSESNSTLARLVRYYLTDKPIYISNNDDEDVNEELMKYKLAILSFNSVKGCERECVIIINYDEVYFQYWDRKWGNDSKLPNILSVVATRAIKQIIIVADMVKPLRTIVVNTLFNDVKTIGSTRIGKAKVWNPEIQKNKKYTVSSLTRHLHPYTLKLAMSLIDCNPVVDNIIRNCPNINSSASFTETAEDIRFVYGILATVIAEVKRYKTSRFNPSYVIEYDPRKIKTMTDNQVHITEYSNYPPIFWKLVDEALLKKPLDRNPVEWSVLAILNHALKDGRHHIARQIKNYDWVDSNAIDQASEIVLAILTNIEGFFEVDIVKNMLINDNKIVQDIIISGRIDFLSADGVIWEFKLGSLTEENILQLGCYLAMKGGGSGVLVSILNQERRELFLSEKNADKFLHTLLNKITDDNRTVFDIIRDFDLNNI